MTKLSIFLSVLFLFALKANSQSNFSLMLSQHFSNYLIENVQEKIYVQTNSNEFEPGDTIWFKSTLVNAVTHTPADIEKMVYIDLISPDN